MEVWQMALWAVAAFIAIRILTGAMFAEYERLMDEIHTREAAEEAEKHLAEDLAEQAEKKRRKRQRKSGKAA